MTDDDRWNQWLADRRDPACAADFSDRVMSAIASTEERRSVGEPPQSDATANGDGTQRRVNSWNVVAIVAAGFMLGLIRLWTLTEWIATPVSEAIVVYNTLEQDVNHEHRP